MAGGFAEATFHFGEVGFGSHFSQLLALAPRSARFCGAERFEARSLAASSRATALREGQEVKDMRGCGTACQFNPSAHGVPVSFEL